MDEYDSLMSMTRNELHAICRERNISKFRIGGILKNKSELSTDICQNAVSKCISTRERTRKAATERWGEVLFLDEDELYNLKYNDIKNICLARNIPLTYAKGVRKRDLIKKIMAMDTSDD